MKVKFGKTSFGAVQVNLDRCTCCSLVTTLCAFSVGCMVEVCILSSAV